MALNTPSESDFWIHHIEALETCNICLEPFDQTHTALRFTGKDACPHIFGDICLREWFETASKNANKCPICRRILWESDDPNHITNTSEIVDDADFSVGELLLDDLRNVSDEDLAQLLANLESASLELDSMLNGDFASGYDSDAATAGGDDSMSLRSFSSLMAEISGALHLGEHQEQATSQLLESGRSLDTGVDGALDVDWEEVLDIADECLLSERSYQVQADDDTASNEAMSQLNDEATSQFTTSVLNLDDDTEDEIEDDLVASEGERIQTIALSDCARTTIDELVNRLFHATEPGDLMPIDADVIHIQERMEHCIDLVLEEAGYKQPFLVDPGPVDAMLGQVKGLVIYRRMYVVSNTYMRWWKDVMLSHINGKGTRPFRGSM